MCREAGVQALLDYGAEDLPVCGISFEEAVDFFMHFDCKDFDNPRLQIKKESFLTFYENMDANLKTMHLFDSFSEAEIAFVEKLLASGLPDALLRDDLTINIILIVSIGNSFGWPYENSIVLAKRRILRSYSQNMALFIG